MRPQKALHIYIKLGNVCFEKCATALKRAIKMDKCEDGMIYKEAKVLARDVSRFRTLFPNGEAQLRQNPTNHFEFLNSAEMVAASSTTK